MRLSVGEDECGCEGECEDECEDEDEYDVFAYK